MTTMSKPSDSSSALPGGEFEECDLPYVVRPDQCLIRDILTRFHRDIYFCQNKPCSNRWDTFFSYKYELDQHIRAEHTQSTDVNDTQGQDLAQMSRIVSYQPSSAFDQSAGDAFSIPRPVSRKQSKYTSCSPAYALYRTFNLVRQRILHRALRISPPPLHTNNSGKRLRGKVLRSQRTSRAKKRSRTQLKKKRKNT